MANDDNTEKIDLSANIIYKTERLKRGRINCGLIPALSCFTYYTIKNEEKERYRLLYQVSDFPISKESLNTPLCSVSDSGTPSS